MAIKGMINSKLKFPLIVCEARPLIEFKTINALEVAAVCFAFAHPKNKSSGLKKTPPPIPRTPAANPKIIPIVSVVLSGICESTFEVFISRKNNNLIPDKINATERSKSKVGSEIFIKPPINAAGIDVKTNGSNNFFENILTCNNL